jgi:DNA-binding response OmpR family regulator
MPRILVVDDDPDVIEAVTTFLESAGHIVKSARDRREGMIKVGVEKPDLIILDVMMEEPDDGFAMALELRRGGFTKPILMLTSIARLTGMSYGVDASTVPVDDFVEKPVAPAVLLEKVAALLK